MKARGSVLIMFLWVLILFSLFALSIAFRTRIATKIQAYDSIRLSQERDALTAVNLARYFLDQDDQVFQDSRSDVWYGIPRGFEKTPFAEKFSLTITDEESKLNINQASPEMLRSVLEVLSQKGVRFDTEPKELASLIVAWCGQTAGFGSGSLVGKQKLAPYESLDELFLVPNVSTHDARALMPYLTVYGSPSSDSLQINLNTVDSSVLEGVIKSLYGSENLKQVLFEKIEKFRSDGYRSKQQLIPFQARDLHTGPFIELLQLEDSVAMNILVGQLMPYATVDSQIFMVRILSRSAGPQAGGGGFIRHVGWALHRKVPARADDQENVAAEIILGPLLSRVSVANGRAADGENAHALSIFSKFRELEVLSWHENFLSAVNR